MQQRRFGSKSETFGRDEMAEREIADKALLEIVVAVVYFIFSVGVLVMTLLRGHFPLEMRERIKRLKQYRKQYCAATNELKKCQGFFHLAKLRLIPFSILKSHLKV